MIETLRIYPTVKKGFHYIDSVGERESVCIQGDFDECIKHWCAAYGYKYHWHVVMDTYNTTEREFTVVAVEMSKFNSTHVADKRRKLGQVR